jgi:hypothetical protein
MVDTQQRGTPALRFAPWRKDAELAQAGRHRTTFTPETMSTKLDVRDRNQKEPT